MMSYFIFLLLYYLLVSFVVITFCLKLSELCACLYRGQLYISVSRRVFIEEGFLSVSKSSGRLWHIGVTIVLSGGIAVLAFAVVSAAAKLGTKDSTFRRGHGVISARLDLCFD